MGDFLSPEERSERMSRVRAKNTRPELIVRRYLHGAGFRYRLHAHGMPGTPDLVLPKYRLVIFVNGCFWHGHSCRRKSGASSEFWEDKIKRNKERDFRNLRDLRQLGWRVLTVWECSLSRQSKARVTLERLTTQILEKDRQLVVTTSD